MSEQSRKVSSETVPEWAQGLYYNKGIFDEAVISYDEAVYFECRGKDSGIVRFTYEMLETRKQSRRTMIGGFSVLAEGRDGGKEVLPKSRVDQAVGRAGTTHGY